MNTVFIHIIVVLLKYSEALSFWGGESRLKLWCLSDSALFLWKTHNWLSISLFLVSGALFWGVGEGHARDPRLSYWDWQTWWVILWGWEAKMEYDLFFFPEKMLPASLLKMDGNRFLPINHGFDLTSFNSKSSNSFPFLLIPVYPIPFHYIFLTLFYKFHIIYVDMKFYSAYWASISPMDRTLC